MQSNLDLAFDFLFALTNYMMSTPLFQTVFGFIAIAFAIVIIKQILLFGKGGKRA